MADVKQEKASKSDEQLKASTSFFEFWPTWVMYLPVVVQWIVLAVRYRSLTLPLIANPNIPLAGMVGASKADAMAEATKECKAAILPWFRHIKSSDALSLQAQQVRAQAAEMTIELPFVCKPDLGCRGAGVKLIKSVEQLEQTLKHYPEGAGAIIQKLADYQPEVGVFYVRMPNEEKGQVVSLTFKDNPSVVGDGVHTLAELVEKEPRAGQLLHLYERRNEKNWQRVLDEGEQISLLFSASHCRGAVFRNGKQHITPELTHAIDVMMKGLPDFYYGRLDIKYADLAALEAGKQLQVVEINGASSEAIHIWDKDTRFLDAITTLMWQYRTLFKIGALVRQQGVKTPSILKLWHAWRHEQSLTVYYPETD